MITNDIPAVPQFLMRETDRHALQAMATHKADRQANNRACPEEKRSVQAPSPAPDIASTDLLAPLSVEAPIETNEGAAPRIALSSMARAVSPASGYSVEDLRLFRALTGYRLDTHTPIWRAVDDNGNRASIADRLFTTLAEEAFRFADRQRNLGDRERKDLTVDDLAMTLPSIRRAATSIGSRGLSAFARLEQVITRFKEETGAETSTSLR
ncbi:hypothetical protein [Aliirhizobium smilacinae]|uniref:Uncharacterized protein n=1 Tax=Aliirhizobium smilacinae TaxID=1395944 RepID=A0A5C4XQ74_9HYPH|nr:hypothetical protein [Rhizobium smilacinae]TNM65746.1 hypothetical protein FHP24_05745 [Rhizobium smilacinae]